MSSDQTAFDVLADRTLHALEAVLCEIDGIDAELQSGVLTIEFGDGESFVVNSHGAARQIWMAAGARAWHFDVAVDTGQWTATRTGEELWSCLGREIGGKLGRAVVLEPRG